METERRKRPNDATHASPTGRRSGMTLYTEKDIISQVAENMLKVCAEFIRADTYSFYLNYDLMIPIANYFPGVEYPSLNVYPETPNSPVAEWLKTQHRTTHNGMPETKDIWESSSRRRILEQEDLKYMMAIPLMHEEHFLGSVNLSRCEPAFNDEETRMSELVSRMIEVFFKSSEDLFKNNAYFTMDFSNGGTINLEIHRIEANRLDAVGFQEWQLTDREQEVTDLLVEGCTYEEMAKRLVVSVNTVKFHLRNIYRKTGTNSKIRLIQTLFGGGDE